LAYQFSLFHFSYPDNDLWQVLPWEGLFNGSVSFVDLTFAFMEVTHWQRLVVLVDFMLL
jgi:hypothetical protein